MPLNYGPLLFRDREYQINQVLSTAQKLAAGEQLKAQTRAIHFSGFVGFGKSWLLCHLHHLITKGEQDRIPPIPNAIVLHIRLWQDWMSIYLDARPYHKITDALLRELLEQIRAARGVTPAPVSAPNASLQKTSDSVRDAVKYAQGKQIVVLLVDEIDEVPHDWLGVLEERLFAPLIQQYHVLLVMTGRNLEHNWNTEALVPLEDKAIRLNPLTQKDTREQLEVQVPAAAPLSDHIFKITDGAPGGNWALAVEYELHHRMPNEIGALEQHNAQMMQGVDPDLRWCLYALSLPRGFDTEWMETLLPIADPAGGAWDYDACKACLKRLVDTRLVHWDKKAGKSRYWLDEYLGPKLERELKGRAPALWKKLQQTLLQMYTEWKLMTRDPRVASSWQDEVDYHVKCL